MSNVFTHEAFPYPGRGIETAGHNPADPRLPRAPGAHAGNMQTAPGRAAYRSFAATRSSRREAPSRP